jgi:hypothetical protein
MVQQEKQIIADDLKNALEKNGIIITEFDYSVNGTTGDITAFVTSGSFESKDEYERQDMIWNAIKKDVPEREHLHISGVIPLTLKEGEQHNG